MHVIMSQLSYAVVWFGLGGGVCMQRSKLLACCVVLSPPVEILVTANSLGLSENATWLFLF